MKFFLKGLVIGTILLTIISFRIENSYYYKISSIRQSNYYAEKYGINLTEGQILSKNEYIAIPQIKGLSFKTQIINLPFERDVNLLTTFFLVFNLLTISIYWLRKK
jgi:hypothetical protein